MHGRKRQSVENQDDDRVGDWAVVPAFFFSPLFSPSSHPNTRLLQTPQTIHTLIRRFPASFPKIPRMIPACFPAPPPPAAAAPAAPRRLGGGEPVVVVVAEFFASASSAICRMTPSARAFGTSWRSFRFVWPWRIKSGVRRGPPPAPPARSAKSNQATSAFSWASEYGSTTPAKKPAPGTALAGVFRWLRSDISNADPRSEKS